MNCNLCPRKCNIERSLHESDGVTGFCGEGNTMRISRAALHFWEEPCLSGLNGSGTVFFTGCNLKKTCKGAGFRSALCLQFFRL